MIMTREEEMIKCLKSKVKITHDVMPLLYKAAEFGLVWADIYPKNPWVTDRMPEIKENGLSDPVLLHVDGQFIKVSRYCRRKDGSTYWNGVEDWNGEEVDAWMPIPELPKGE